MDQIASADIRKRVADFALDEWRRETQRLIKNSMSLDDQRWFMERLLIICERAHIATPKNLNPNINLKQLRYANSLYLAVVYRAEKLWIKYLDALTRYPEGRLHAFNFRRSMMEMMGCDEGPHIAADVERVVNQNLPNGMAPWKFSELDDIKYAADGALAYEIQPDTMMTRDEANYMISKIVARS